MRGQYRVGYLQPRKGMLRLQPNLALEPTLSAPEIQPVTNTRVTPNF